MRKNKTDRTRIQEERDMMALGKDANQGPLKVGYEEEPNTTTPGPDKARTTGYAQASKHDTMTNGTMLGTTEEIATRQTHTNADSFRITTGGDILIPGGGSNTRHVKPSDTMDTGIVDSGRPLLTDDDDTTMAHVATFDETPTTTVNTRTDNRTSHADTAKGTTCAFPPTTTDSPSTNHSPPLPLDDTMAHAVETLQIGHNNNHTSSSRHTLTNESHWTIVTNISKKDPANTTANHTNQEFGLAFERTTKSNNWSTEDLLLILQTIKTHDPKAMLSSADNKTKPTLVTAILHKAQKDTPWFTKFTAMKTMIWGKPTDGTTKIVFSFWLTSTIIKKDLAQLRMDSADFTEMLKGTNTYMKVTKILEPHSKIVGYFLGKDIIHTNRDDITNRLAAHIIKHSQTHWTPALDVLNTTVLGKGHNTRMVTLVVGNSDYQGVSSTF